MSAPTLSRRRLLQTGLATAASVPLMRALGGVARAQAAGLTNFVCIYHPHGVSAEYWAMRQGDTATTFDIGYENCSLLAARRSLGHCGRQVDVSLQWSWGRRGQLLKATCQAP